MEITIDRTTDQETAIAKVTGTNEVYCFDIAETDEAITAFITNDLTVKGYI